MKKVRFLLSALAFAVVLAGASKAVPAAAETNSPVVDYSGEFIQIPTGFYGLGNVYYQVIKDPAIATVKATSWIPVTSKDAEGCYIDVSSFTKTGYVAITTNNNAVKAEEFTVVTIKAPVKSLKVTVDFKTDNPMNLYDALATANGVNTDATVNATYNLDSSDAEKHDRLADFLTVYTLAWKRGANGTWKKANQTDVETEDADFRKNYQMLRASNSTLYIRVVEAKVGNDSKAAVIPSKEIKVKIAKTAAAPVIKINYKAGTIPLKNGMEFIYGGKTYYIPTYDKNSKSDAKITETSQTTTKTKVTSLSVADIQAITHVAAGESYTVNYRTTATAKKYASWYGEIVLAAPIAAPVGTVNFSVNDKEKTIKLDFKGITDVEGRTLEYAFGGTDADPSSLRWTAVGTSKEADASASLGKTVSYKNAAKEAKTVKYEEATLFYRFAAIEDKADSSKNVFPGAYATMTPTEVSKTTVTFTLTGEATVQDSDEAVLDTSKPVEVYKGEFKFAVIVAEGKTVTVTCGGTEILPEEGFYTVSVATALGISITVTDAN